ncbi:MAG: SpoIIE family protein phosphatase [Pyrinomonadaceae bacterium]|nr:SpoIIE family protein phosphatase [Pyrinomonadaceae bacterium]MCX7639214.1 SpoIIE family protein phosphatase [Pyrinomonadaceae bacterium]MDW8303564.1 SpoIIE family protein phosphatase [Acidobacteriota bacterium]
MQEPIKHFSDKDKNLTVVDKLRMLLDITKKISLSLDLDEVLDLVMDTLDSLIHYDAAGIYLIEHDQTEDNPYIFKSKRLRGYEISFELIEPRLKMGEGFIGYVAQTGQPIICPDVSKDPRYFPARPKTKSEMVAPIISNNEVIGVFDLECDYLNAYDEDDLSVLQLLASQVAIIIEKVKLHQELIEKKRLEAQIEVARQVQFELLPEEDPQLEGFDMSAYIFPADEVSGDYYDWVKIFEDQIGIIIADAAGKGIPAALLMAFLRASLRTGMQIGYAPHVALAKVSNLLWDSVEEHQFITAIYGILDATNKTFVFSNAGHNPLLLVKSTGEYRFIEYGDLPLGIFRDVHYHQHFLRFDRGDILVLYTDGVVETTNKEGKEFGRERFAQKVVQGSHLSAKELIRFIEESLLDFSESGKPSDDVTIFVIKRID